MSCQSWLWLDLSKNWPQFPYWEIIGNKQNTKNGKKSIMYKFKDFLTEMGRDRMLKYELKTDP